MAESKHSRDIEAGIKAGKAVGDAAYKGFSTAAGLTDKATEAAKKAPGALKKADKFIGDHLSMKALAEKIKRKDIMAVPDSYKKGGKVKKTGLALVHKGEKVLTKKQQKTAKPVKKTVKRKKK